MKSCFSVLIVIFLIPLLFAAVFSTTILNVAVSEDTYKKILVNEDIKSNINDFLVYSIRDNISQQSDSLRNIASSAGVKIALEKFVSDLNMENEYSRNIYNVVNYVNGSKEDLNINLNINLDKNKIDNLKENIIASVSESILNLKKCTSDSEYNKAITEGKIPDCRISSITSQDVIDRVREITEAAFNYNNLSTVIHTKLPISEVTKNRLYKLRNIYSQIHLATYIIWFIIAWFILFIILLNVFGSLTFFNYFAAASFFTALLTGGCIFAFRLLSTKVDLITTSELWMSDEFSIDTLNSAANFINNTIAKLSNILMIDFILFTAFFLFITIIFWITNFVLSRKRDKIEFKTHYYIPAYTASKEVENINENMQKENEELSQTVSNSSLPKRNNIQIPYNADVNKSYQTSFRKDDSIDDDE